MAKKTILSMKRLTINALEKDEEDFANTLVDANLNKWKVVDPVLSDKVFSIRNGSGYFYNEESKKETIVLHHTMGYLSNDMANLSKGKVSVPYTIARDGTIYELFDPRLWAYHIGTEPRSNWRNPIESKRSIGIELSNFGPLKEHSRKKDILVDYWNFPYCMKSNDGFYHKESYRGFEYWATYTDAQYRSLNWLVEKLCREFDIPHRMLPVDERFSLLKNIPKEGILSHVNFRSQKTDVSPAFDYLRIKGF